MWVLSLIIASNFSYSMVEIKDATPTTSFATAKKLRETKKVGIGVNYLGASGVMGAQIELNFTPEASLVSGFGVGDGMQSYSFTFKRFVSGKSVLPYVGFGYARWYSVEQTGDLPFDNPKFLNELFLNDEERRTGVFNEHLIFPTAGLQFMGLSGSWTSFSILAEVVVLFDVEDFVGEPTGSLGLFYYF